VFLDQLTAGGLMDHVARVGAHLVRGLRALASRHPAVVSVRGEGVMWGIELDRPAALVVDAARERKLLVNRTSDTVVRLLPPYIITEQEIDEALPLLEAAIATAVEAPRT
jgi:acetylornithine/succinyldiaminopimelate/putrescine aminotransferase